MCVPVRMSMILMIISCRCDFKQILDVMVYDSSSDQSASSEEDELDTLLLDLAFAPKRMLGTRINLQDIPDVDCERMFRYLHACILNGKIISS